MNTVEVEKILLLAVPPVVSAVTLAAMHWFPWHRGAKQLERTTAYMLGTLVTVGIPVITMLLAAAMGAPQSELFWAVLLCINAAIGGITVMACYAVDETKPVTMDDVARKERRL